MKHTFIDAKTGLERTVNIPNEDLERIKRGTTAKTTEAAVEVWLSDEGYVVDSMVEELTAKAAKNSTRVTGTKKRKAPTRKPDYTKRKIVDALKGCVSNLEGADNVEVTNIERIVRFTVGTDTYEVTLSKKRAPKDN